MCHTALSVPDDEVNGLIDATLPTGEGQRHRMIFELVRQVMPRFGDELTTKDWRIIASRWYRRAHPVIGTKDWETTWLDFLGAIDGYDPVKAAGGLASLVEQGRQWRPPPAVAEHGSAPFDDLARLCWLLSRRSEDGVFFLSGHAAAMALGLAGRSARQRAWKMLKLLCGERCRVLELVTKGCRGKASEYRWIGPTLELVDQPADRKRSEAA